MISTERLPYKHAQHHDDETANEMRAVDLTLPFSRGITAPADFRLGVELEYFPVDLSTLAIVPYDAPHGIRGIFVRLMAAYAWTPVYEAHHIVALTRHGESITLEPGGVIEYSSLPCRTIWGLEQAIARFLREFLSVTRALGIGLLPLGFHPFATPDEVALVPKSRYKIMEDYMPLVGTHGRHMMKLTCSTQITIDFCSEADAMQKMQLAARLTPFFLALSANSALCQGSDSGMASRRGQAWLRTDPARTGWPDFLFHRQASFMDYAAWALEVPMYFLERGGEKVALRHCSFGDFLEHGIVLPHAARRTYATQDDWQLHLSTVFPWVRLRSYLELRAFDVHSPEVVVALLALVKGLFYSATSLQALEAVVGSYDKTTTERLLHAAIADGVEGQACQVNIREVLLTVLDIAHSGLVAQEQAEEHYLIPLETILAPEHMAARQQQIKADMPGYVRAQLL